MNYSLLLPVVSFLVVFPAILMIQIYLLGCKLSEPEKMIRAIDGGLSEAQKQTLAHYSQWLASVNLDYRANFRFGSIEAIVFQQGDKPRFLSVMFHQRLTFSAESYLEDLTILDTSTSGSLGLFPRPGAYAQSLPGMSLPEMWQRHLEGEAYLSKKFGYDWKPINRPYLELVLDATRLRMQCTRKRFLWPLRTIYHFFVTRFQLRGKTLAQQYP